MIGLPASWPILGAVVAAAFVAGTAGGWTANGWRLESKLQALQAEHAGLVADAAKRTAAAQLAQREEEARRVAAQQEIAHVAAQARSRADADRRGADAAGRRLLDAARAAAGRACPTGADSTAVAVGPPAPEPVRALADVLSEASESAGEMAAAVDAARVAGNACASAYESLTVDKWVK